MKRLIRITPLLLLLVVLVYAGAKITILNPAWVIARKYPNATVTVYTVNSPDPHFWSMLARAFGIPMTDPDRALKVSIVGSSELLRLDDFAGADELTISASKIADISAFVRRGARLSDAVFVDCDFSHLRSEQRTLLKPHSTSVPNSFYIPYEEKRKAEQTHGADAGPAGS